MSGWVCHRLVGVRAPQIQFGPTNQVGSEKGRYTGHTTDQCTALRHVVQDLNDQVIVQLGQPSISSNPLPTYSTHVAPPPTGGIHSIDFAESEDRIHMLSWDNQTLEPIAFDDGYGNDGVHDVFSSQQIHSHVVSASGITPV